jgi:hypothetical protein
MSSYAGVNNKKITNRFTAGGSKKSGLSQHIGMGPFVYGAIKGKSGRGANWIPHFSMYKVSNVNQIGGVGMPRWGMFGPTADGVNVAKYNAMVARVKAGPTAW